MALGGPDALYWARHWRGNALSCGTNRCEDAENSMQTRLCYEPRHRADLNIR